MCNYYYYYYYYYYYLVILVLLFALAMVMEFQNLFIRFKLVLLLVHLILLQADNFLMGKLFSKNLQNRMFKQVNSSCIKTPQRKPDNLISNCVSYDNSMKTIKHLLLIMIFCKTIFTKSYTTVGPPSYVSIH